MKQYPLVSVRILTYNSSQYIVETLNSVYNQTYNNIELVVSDDCSKDNTVSVCEDWIDTHYFRFSNVVFLTTSINTGICANSKRSLEATTGDWIKGLGGDDCLYPNAIEEYVRFVKDNQCDICAAEMSYFDESSNDLNINLGVGYDDYMDILKQSYKKQYRLMKQRIIVPGPVLFYSREIYQRTGGPNPKYGTADEWSFLYKIAKSGYRIHGLNKVLIKYRIRKDSVCRLQNENGKSPYYKKCNSEFMREVIMPDLLRHGELLLYWHLFIKALRWGKSNNYKFLYILDPLWYVSNAIPAIKHRINK